MPDELILRVVHFEVVVKAVDLERLAPDLPGVDGLCDFEPFFVHLDSLDREVLEVLVAQVKNGINGVPDRTALATTAAHLEPELVAMTVLTGKLAL